MDPEMMMAAEQALGGPPAGGAMAPPAADVPCPTCGQPWPPEMPLPPELDPMMGDMPPAPAGGGLPFGPGPMG